MDDDSHQKRAHADEEIPDEQCEEECTDGSREQKTTKRSKIRL